MSFDSKDLEDAGRFLPLSPQDFQVLLLLSDESLHGYGIVKASEDERGEPTLELGSLYRILSRMLDTGLVEDAGSSPSERGRARRLYSATELGRLVASAEARRLDALLKSDVATRLLGNR